MGSNSEINPDIIFFDGVCNLCNGAVNFIIDRDRSGRFKFAALQSDFAKKKLALSGIEPHKLDSIVVVDSSNGKIREKSSAALHIARKLNGLWPILYVFIILPRFLRDGVYDIIAKNRYRWFGRTDQCRMPSPELNKRFILDT